VKVKAVGKRTGSPAVEVESENATSPSSGDGVGKKICSKWNSEHSNAPPGNQKERGQPRMGLRTERAQA